MLRVSQHYRDDRPTLKRFRAGELHTATDHGFWLVLKRIHRQATLLLADLGKRIHLNVDESKYNDYVLYPKSGGAEPEEEQQVFEEEVATETVLNLSVTNLDGTETMIAHNSGTVPIAVYFASMPTDLPEPDMGELAPGQEASGTIVETGFEAGVKEYLNVYNPSTDTAGSIELTVSVAQDADPSDIGQHLQIRSTSDIQKTDTDLNQIHP